MTVISNELSVIYNQSQEGQRQDAHIGIRIIGLSMSLGGGGERQKEGSGVQCLISTILFLNAFDGIYIPRMP